jgi:hypothetical protein
VFSVFVAFVVSSYSKIAGVGWIDLATPSSNADPGTVVAAVERAISNPVNA